MRKGVSLAELVIVAAILGIMAAIVVPYLQLRSTEAKGAVAKDHLRMFRSTIELYAAHHGGVPPGYEDDDTTNPPSGDIFREQTTEQGNYLRKMPANPFNNLDTMLVIGKNDAFPEEPTGEYGWVYQPSERIIKLDWLGTDRHGLDYFDY
jgi:prepilin-type N-terminal cleavage/methylation domain-containing protein